MILTASLTFAAVGHGMILVPNNVIVQEYFSRRRDLAVALASSGRSLGPMMFGPIHRLLIQSCGWRVAMGWLAAMVTQSVVCVACMRPPESDTSAYGKSRTIGDTKEMHEKHDGKETSANERLLLDNEKAQLQNGIKQGSLVSGSKMSLSGLSCSSGSQKRDIKQKSILHKLFVNIRKSFHVSLLRDPVFLVYLMARSLSMSGEITLYTYAVARGIHQGFPKIAASFLITCIAVSTLIGRVGLGVVTSFRHVNKLGLYAASTILGGGLLCLTTVIPNSYPLHMILCALFGFTLGKDCRARCVLH